ncbi:hypothetical protein SLI_4861 [Streptomyces lividans 1326]|uniref:Uncharacterized protein n=1 Tax=Streptomyces lividans 1326 TaxID=1200984 RepID=A0A7U9HCV8_STRLI|nr:hypothetical protein SLI_4861 [Streptomyces lividans 1326]
MPGRGEDGRLADVGVPVGEGLGEDGDPRGRGPRTASMRTGASRSPSGERVGVAQPQDAWQIEGGG